MMNQFVVANDSIQLAITLLGWMNETVQENSDAKNEVASQSNKLNELLNLIGELHLVGHSIFISMESYMLVS